MFSYVVGGIAFLLFFYNPIVQLLSTEPARIPRLPRPAVNESLLALDAANETALSCPPDAYSVRIVSKAPLVIYIENFLSASEREHLLEIRSVPPASFPPSPATGHQPSPYSLAILPSLD